MKIRKLGKNLEVSEIDRGLMGMDHAYGLAKDRQEMIKLIRRSVDPGGNYFDTAIVYGEGNERVLADLEVHSTYF